MNQSPSEHNGITQKTVPCFLIYSLSQSATGCSRLTVSRQGGIFEKSPRDPAAEVSAEVSPLLPAENLVEDLLGDFEFEVQTPYLLYRNAVQEVNGIWFYNPRECEDAAKLMTRWGHVSLSHSSRAMICRSQCTASRLKTRVMGQDAICRSYVVETPPGGFRASRCLGGCLHAFPLESVSG